MGEVDKGCPVYLAEKLWEDTDGQPTQAQVEAACNACGGSGAAIGYERGRAEEREAIAAEVERRDAELRDKLEPRAPMRGDRERVERIYANRELLHSLKSWLSTRAPGGGKRSPSEEWCKAAAEREMGHDVAAGVPDDGGGK